MECGLATYVQCEFRHPATKTQDPCEVHDHDRNITGKDTNPFSEGRETQLYYGRGKTGVPGEKTAAHGTRLNDANPEPRVRNIARPGGTATTPTNLTNNFKMLPDRGWHHLPKKNDIGMPIVDPWLSRYTNTSKSAREIFAAILNESHRLTSIMTQTAKDQEK